VLGIVEGLVVLDLVAGRLEEEGCGELAEVKGMWGVDALGSASSNMVACYYV
jgi:hypothetical protein